jgi:Na+(H+)/acetate symporter ActP
MEEVLDNVSDNGGNLKITQSIKTSLKSACDWAKVISIIQIVLLGIGMVGGLIALFWDPIVGFTILSVYGFLFFIALILLQFGIKTMKGIASSSQNEFEQGMEKLSLWFKIIGVFTIVITTLYLVFLIIFGGWEGISKFF